MVESMMLAREFEQNNASMQAAGKAPGTCTSVGQEASAVGVVRARADRIRQQLRSKPQRGNMQAAFERRRHKPLLLNVSPTELSLSVTALDPNTQMVKSVTLNAGLGGATLNAAENSEIIIVVSAKDSGGIKAIRIWNVGANLVDMSQGEYVATPNSAFQSVTRQAVMKAAPGLKLGVFAEADNFGTGGPAQTTAHTGAVALNVTGVTEPEFTGSTGTTTLAFHWNNGAQAYVSAGAPSPTPGAKVVAVLVGTPFGGGVHVSLYRGSGNINNLDLRTDFVRTWQAERLNLLNGSWSSQPWYALRGNSRQKGISEMIEVQLRWEGT